MCFNNHFHAHRAGFKGGAAQHPFNRFRQDHPFAKAFQKVPVNVLENENNYEIHVIAPGLAKEDFKLHLKEDVLSISYQQPEQTAGTTWTHREHQISSFERSFALNNKINTEAISAKYEGGILIVTLPKTYEAQQAPQNIQVQ